MTTSTEALFMALANTQEAQRAAAAQRNMARGNTSVTMPPHELISTLQLVNHIVKALGGTVRSYARTTNSIRGKNTTGPLDALAYDTARELETLSRHLRRGAPVANSIAAATALDIKFRRHRATNT